MIGKSYTMVKSEVCYTSLPAVRLKFSNRQFGVLRAGFDELNLDLDALNRSLDARRLTGFRSRGFQINSLTLYQLS